MPCVYHYAVATESALILKSNLDMEYSLTFSANVRKPSEGRSGRRYSQPAPSGDDSAPSHVIQAHPESMPSFTALKATLFRSILKARTNTIRMPELRIARSITE